MSDMGVVLMHSIPFDVLLLDEREKVGQFGVELDFWDDIQLGIDP